MQARGDWFDALRLKNGRSGEGQSLLAQALAGAEVWQPKRIYVAAAKRRAVVETLDEVGAGRRRRYPSGSRRLAQCAACRRCDGR